jgi:hypothetical protein
MKAPLRNFLGNKITCWVFHLLSRQKVMDTQTGLRGFSRSYLPLLLNCGGTRYEYEMNVLYTWVKCQLPVMEIPIQTIYVEKNRNSHFRPIVDSFRIYLDLLGLRLQK